MCKFRTWLLVAAEVLQTSHVRSQRRGLVVSMIFGGHLGFMQIRRGCWSWKIGHPSCSDKLDHNEEKNAKKINLSKQCPQEPIF